MIRSLFTLALLLVVGGGAAAYLMGQATPPGAADVPAVPASTEAATSFDDKVLSVEAALAEAKRTGVAQPIALELSDAELTSKAAVIVSSFSGGIVPTDPEIRVQPGNILLTAKVSFLGSPFAFSVNAVPVLLNGRAGFSIDSVQSALPLPDGIKTEINTQIAKILSPESLGFAFDVTKIEALDGRLVLEGLAKP